MSLFPWEDGYKAARMQASNVAGPSKAKTKGNNAICFACTSCVVVFWYSFKMKKKTCTIEIKLNYFYSFHH